jgi:hypothetical protein
MDIETLRMIWGLFPFFCISLILIYCFFWSREINKMFEASLKKDREFIERLEMMVKALEKVGGVV